MKTKIYIPVLIFLGFMFFCGNELYAQTDTTSVREMPERTAEEKEYYSLFETPDSELSIDTQIIKYELFGMVARNYYIKEGEIKTKCTEEDFVKIGVKPFFYKIFLKQLEEINEILRNSGDSVEERQKSLEEDLKGWKETGKYALDKLEKLKKLKEEEKENKAKGSEESQASEKR